jgi:hypothetical protein
MFAPVFFEVTVRTERPKIVQIETDVRIINIGKRQMLDVMYHLCRSAAVAA